jgi:hypothetical protein
LRAAPADLRSRFFNFGGRMGAKSEEPEAGSREPGGARKHGKGEPGKCEECSRWKEIRKKARVADLLATAIAKLKARFEAEDFKPSVADYLKLVEMEEELEQGSDAVKEIKVTWVEPTESGTEG